MTTRSAPGQPRADASDGRRRRSPWRRLVAYTLALVLVIHVMLLLDDRGPALLSRLLGDGEADAPTHAPLEPVPLREIIVPVGSAPASAAPESRSP